MSLDVQTVIPTPTLAETEGLGIADYLGVFKRRSRLIIMPCILLTLLAGILAYVIPPKYSTFTRFKVLDPGVLKGVVGYQQAIIPHKPLLTTMDFEIKRKPFLQPIVSKIGLTEGFNLNDPEEHIDFFDYVIKNLAIDKTLNTVGSDIITITYTGRDSNRIVDFLNTVRENYYAEFRSDFRRQVALVYEQSRGTFEEIERTYQQVSDEYETFRNSPDYPLIGVDQDRQREQIGLKDKRRDLQIVIRDLEGQLKTVEAQIRAQDTQEVTLNLVPNPERTKRATAAKALRDKLSQLVDVQGYTELVPVVVETRAELRKVERQIDELPKLVEATRDVGPNRNHLTLLDQRLDIQRQLQGKRASLAQIESRLEIVGADVEKIPQLTAEDSAFAQKMDIEADKLKAASRRFDLVRGSWEQVRAKGSDLFQVLDFPDSKEPPVFPSIPLFLGIGAAAGLILGVGLAFLKEFSGMTYMSAAQVQHTLPLPILGEVGQIESEAERREHRRRRLRNIAVAVVIIGLLGFIHLCYFVEEFTHWLPPVVADLMDVIYKGTGR